MIARLTGIGVALLLGAAGLFADTIPGGDVSGNWYQANSPYYIAGNITIPLNDTLTIEPGVDVIFLGYYWFSIQGALEAVGSASDSIRFMPQDTLTGWDGLGFASGVRTCRLSYGDIRYAYNSGIRLIASREVYISHCTITHCRHDRGGGIFVDLTGSLRLSNSTIANNTAESYIGGKGGGICVWNGDTTVSIDSCAIRDNRALIPIYTTHWPYDTVAEGGGIYTRRGDERVVITNCAITGNQVMRSNGDFAGLARGGGLYIGSQRATLTGCVIRNNEVKSDNFGYSQEYMDGSGIYLDSDGGSYSAQVSRCEVSRNVATCCGAFHVRRNNVTITNCTLFGNLDTYSTPLGYAFFVNDNYGSAVALVNCIIAYNNRGIYGQTTDCQYSDIYQDTCINMPGGFGVLDTVNHNGDSCDVFHNIFLDPMFVDTATTDLHLLAGSPCIDAGDPASPYDPDSTIADLGCYYYDQTSGVAIGPPASLRLPPCRACPNPFTSFATLPGHEAERFSLYDITGRKVGTYKGNQIGYGLSPGVYFLRTADGSSKPLRIVKLR
jgi:hypothetical protein